MTRLVVKTFAVCAVLVMAACAGPAGNGVDPLGPADLDAAAATIGEVGVGVLDALERDAAVRSLGVPIGLSATSSTASAALESVAPLADVDLPRGEFEHDPTTGDWVPTVPSTDLVYRWSFVDADDEVREAVMRVDWGTTTDVDDGWDTIEVPTDGMSMLLTIDGETGAAFDVELGWYTAPACPDGVLVPTHGRVDGSIGIDATLALNAVGFTLGDTAFVTSGEIVATAGTQAIGVDWDIDIGIDLERGADCFIDDVEVVDGAVAVAVFGTSAGSTTRLALSFGFSDIQAGEFGGLASVAIDNGQLRLNGAMVVSFSGRLDDENENGIPGENLDLVFADGTTMTLEAYVETYLLEPAALVRRAIALLR